MASCITRSIVLQEALANYEQAIALQPDFAEAYNNRGNTLQNLNRMTEAVSNYEQAIALKSNYAKAYNGRGVALRNLHQLTESIESLERAIQCDTNYAEAYWNKSLSLLTQGNFTEGWRLYEWRWRNENSPLKPRIFAQPLWLGEDNISGKTVLLHAEQGLGDSIQFCRYAQLLAAQGARVILEIPSALYALFQHLDGVDTLLTQGETLPAFDYHCPLLSLPLALSTQLDTIPHSTAYLAADVQKVASWKRVIPQDNRYKVGVVWCGGDRPNQPELWALNMRRNIPLALFATQLSPLHQICFFSLQKGASAEAEIRGKEHDYWPQGNFYNFAHALHDFSDTAGLIAHLDLVISVDTAVAHLAAALGKPTWILNRYDTCWRWFLQREDSPWYPSVKLYRQENMGDWQAVLAHVAHDLQALAKP